DNKNHFDFWAISRSQLAESGLRSKHIETTGICTACKEDFFSYRRTSRQKKKPGTTGRNGSVILLP
ncbi:MAG: hypothetical protein D3924_08355, partial [Candidatus Electrothrix sp. AR4]|nr:hypothetical protein [Candidatus Electrothrix sp. AR4]